MGKILWLASYPKSGNTWLRAFLLQLLNGAGGEINVNRIADFCLADSAAGWYAPFIGRPPGDWTIEEVGQARSRAHEKMAAGGPQTVLIKTHNACVRDRFGALIPKRLTAGAIYILRNPLDVAISYSHHLGKSIDQVIDLMDNPGAGTPNTRTNVYQLLRTWSEHAESWTARRDLGPLHVVRYEDLLSEPERSFSALAAFLGLKPTRERLLEAIRNCRFEELRRSEGAHGFKERSRFAERFFREGRAGQWREVLSAAQLRRLTQAHGAAMRRFGYLAPE